MAIVRVFVLGAASFAVDASAVFSATSLGQENTTSCGYVTVYEGQCGNGCSAGAGQVCYDCSSEAICCAGSQCHYGGSSTCGAGCQSTSGYECTDCSSNARCFVCAAGEDEDFEVASADASLDAEKEDFEEASNDAKFVEATHTSSAAVFSATILGQENTTSCGYVTVYEGQCGNGCSAGAGQVCYDCSSEAICCAGSQCHYGGSSTCGAGCQSTSGYECTDCSSNARCFVCAAGEDEDFAVASADASLDAKSVNLEEASIAADLVEAPHTSSAVFSATMLGQENTTSCGYVTVYEGQCGNGCSAGAGQVCYDCSSEAICCAGSQCHYGGSSTCGAGCQSTSGYECTDCSSNARCFVCAAGEAMFI